MWQLNVATRQQYLQMQRVNEEVDARENGITFLTLQDIGPESESFIVMALALVEKAESVILATFFLRKKMMHFYSSKEICKSMFESDLWLIFVPEM